MATGNCGPRTPPLEARFRGARLCLALGVAMLPAMAAAQDAPSGCTAAGETCSDGTILVGRTPDGDRPMYAASVDGEGYDPKGSSWGPRDYGAPIAMCADKTSSGGSCATGRANVEQLLQLNATLREYNGGYDEYQAAVHCDNLDAHGHDDWYLPARDELLAVFDSIGLKPQFGMAGSYFWSSSLQTPAHVWAVYFEEMDGDNLASFAAGEMRVRCVRTP